MHLNTANFRAEMNTSSARLPGSSKYPNYPMASMRIRWLTIFALQQAWSRKLALVGIIPNDILFSFSSDKDRRTDSRIRRKKKHSAAPLGIEPRVLRILLARSNHFFFSSDPAVSSSIFVGAEREKNFIRNDPDKSEFTIEQI